MSTPLQEALDRAIGDGPEHRPVEHAVRAGRRALLARRALTGAAALAVVGAIGTTYALTAPGTPSGRGPEVATTSPSPSPTTAPTPPPEATPGAGRYEQPVELRGDRLVIADGTRVHGQVNDPLGPGPSGSTGFESVAVDVTYRGQRQWLLLQEDDGGGMSVGEDLQASSSGFEAWVDDQVTAYWWQFVVEFGQGQTLVPARAGVEVLEQRGDVALPQQLGQAAVRTAIAFVAFAGEERFVMAWQQDGGPTENLANPTQPGQHRHTLEQQLQSAYETYGGARR